MNLNISSLFSGGIGEIIKEVGDVIDNLHTSNEEKLKLKNQLTQLEKDSNLKAIELENLYQQEISSRWISDNTGNFFTKSARPLTMWYLTIIITLLAILDSGLLASFGVNFSIKEAWLNLFTVAYVTVLGAYFGSKGLERIKNKVVG